MYNLKGALNLSVFFSLRHTQKISKASFQRIFLKSLSINGIIVSYDDSSDEIVLKNTKALFLMR